MTDRPWERVQRRGQVALVLVRHGRTAWNHQGRFLGVTDIPLDDVGHGQARSLAPHLPGFDAIYTSRLARARQTAAALAPPEASVVAGLEELDQGELEGLDRAAALARFPEFFAAWARDPGTACVPGGESLARVQERALRALLGVLPAHGPGQVVAAVTHQLVISSLCCTLAGEALTCWRRYGVPNTGIAVLGWDGSALHLEETGWSPPDPGSPGAGV